MFDFLKCKFPYKIKVVSYYILLYCRKNSLPINSFWLEKYLYWGQLYFICNHNHAMFLYDGDMLDASFKEFVNSIIADFVLQMDCKKYVRLTAKIKGEDSRLIDEVVTRIYETFTSKTI